MSKTAFLFPGQGSQVVGMGQNLAETFPVARRTFEEANDALGFDLSALCFSGPKEQLGLTEFTQPAIFTASIAAGRVLAERGVIPSYVAGHSLGEYSANVTAGSIGFADAVLTVHKRGRWMQEAVPQGKGAMAAILLGNAGMNADDVLNLCQEASKETGEVVAAANMNTPEQIVISGASAAVDRAATLAKERGAKRAVMLQVSAPFHCSLMQPAEDALSSWLRVIPFSDAKIPVVVNVDAAVVTNGDELREALVRQVTRPVRWTESMQLLISQGVTAFVEVGPGKVLGGLLRQIDRGQTCCQVEDAASLEKTLSVMEMGS